MSCRETADDRSSAKANLYWGWSTTVGQPQCTPFTRRAARAAVSPSPSCAGRLGGRVSVGDIFFTGGNTRYHHGKRDHGGWDMLTRAENERLTQVGPGTPGGELLRRYWHPVAVVADLTEEQPTKFVRILGEDLV